MPRHSVFRLVLLTTVGLACGCAKLAKPGEATQRDHVDPAAADAEQKLWWTNRVATTLANGRSTLTAQELSDLAQKPESEVVDALMARDEFLETMISFNLEYLGFRSDKLKYPDGSIFTSSQSLARFPAAIKSANEVKADGDFFTIFDTKLPMYAPPLSQQELIPDPTGKERPIDEVRKEAFQFHRDLLQTLVAEVRQTPTTGVSQVCGQMFMKVDFNKLLNIGLAFDLFNNTFRILGPIAWECSDFDGERDETRAESLLLASQAHWDQLEQYLKTLDPKVYKVTNASSLKTYDLVKLGFATPETRVAEEEKFANIWFWSAMVNSSTNFNRKRASYVLKRFFCDDLTPIAVETPMEHADGQHGADASCQACHYKLDPMAGFFRYNGKEGEIFKGQEQLTFDDDAETVMTDYLKTWQREDGSWNVGYIRSVNDESLNDRSAHPKDPELSDLYQIIRQAPEARQCLVKTMIKFLVGENIAIDAGYLEHLSGEFSAEADQVGSGKALKSTMKKILTSKSYTETNPVEDVCYDYAPGVDPAGLPPCKVARVIEKNCATCHNATNAQGGLNMTSWKEQSDGKMGFDNDGLDSGTTFQSIFDRLSAADEKIRMPLKQHMAPVERETLYLWISEQLASKEESK